MQLIELRPVALDRHDHNVLFHNAVRVSGRESELVLAITQALQIHVCILAADKA